MTAPTLQAEGNLIVNTSGTLTVVIPTHTTNDILILTLCYYGPNTAGDVLDTPTPSGWTIVHGLGGGADGRNGIYWRRATGAGTANPVCSRGVSWDTGTDTAFGGRAYVVRNCVTTGNPWDQAANSGGIDTANGAVQALTVSGTERLAIHFLGYPDDPTNAPTLSGWTAGTDTQDATGTGMNMRTFRKDNVSANTSGDTTAIDDPPSTENYHLWGFSFKPAVQSAAFAAAPAVAQSWVNVYTGNAAFAAAPSVARAFAARIDSFGAFAAVPAASQSWDSQRTAIVDFDAPLVVPQVWDSQRTAVVEFASAPAVVQAWDAQVSVFAAFALEETAVQEWFGSIDVFAAFASPLTVTQEWAGRIAIFGSWVDPGVTVSQSWAGERTVVGVFAAQADVDALFAGQRTAVAAWAVVETATGVFRFPTTLLMVGPDLVMISPDLIAVSGA